VEVNPKAKGLASPEKREVENWVGGQRLTWMGRRKPMLELLLSVYICLNLPLPLGYRDHDIHR